MNEKLIPANSPYWDYKMLQIINNKHKQYLDDYIAEQKAKRRSKIIDNICMALCLLISNGVIAYLLFFAP